MLYHITSCQSYCIILYHIMPNDIISYSIMAWHVMLYHILSYTCVVIHIYIYIFYTHTHTRGLTAGAEPRYCGLRCLKLGIRKPGLLQFIEKVPAARGTKRLLGNRACGPGHHLRHRIVKRPVPLHDVSAAECMQLSLQHGAGRSVLCNVGCYHRHT